MLPIVMTEDFDKIAPEVAKDHLRHVIMELTEEECEWVLQKLEEFHV